MIQLQLKLLQISLTSQKQFFISHCLFNPAINYEGEKVDLEKVTLEVPKMNYIDGDVESFQTTLTADDLKSFQPQPRPHTTDGIIDEVSEEEEKEVEIKKVKWTFQHSLFTEFTQDTDTLMNRCFDQDWRNSKLDKVLKPARPEQKENIYNYLKSIYRVLQVKEAYKFLSAMNPTGTIWSIGTNLLSYIVQNCNGLVDHRNVQLSDVDLEFIATKASNSGLKTKTNPERSLIRYQFLEIFVRLAITRYYKPKIVRTYDEAVIKLFEDNVLPYLRMFDSNNFRLQKLYTEATDKALRKNMVYLKEMYRKYAAFDALPGEDCLMSLNEFSNLIISSGVIDDNFSTREIGTLFNQSMQTQVDEIYSERFTQMNFHEYLEALARVADRAITNIEGVEVKGDTPGDTTKNQNPSFGHSPTIKDGEGEFELALLDKMNQNRQGTNELTLAQKIHELVKRMAMYAMGEDYAKLYQRRNAHINFDSVTKVQKKNAIPIFKSVQQTTKVTTHTIMEQTIIRGLKQNMENSDREPVTLPPLHTGDGE